MDPILTSIARRASALRSSAVRDLLRDAQLPGMISLAGGLPAAELFDVDVLTRAARNVFENRAATALQYGVTEGYEPLREQLAQLMEARGALARWRDILITSGSQQALDLIVRVLTEAGDSVAAPEPTYLAALQVFALNEVEVAPLDITQPTLDAPIKLAYVVTNFANPTGETWTYAARRELLHWAVRNRVFVVEDDPYGELRFADGGLPPLIEIARTIPGADQWCCYISTLSKVVSPGLRIGWIIAPEWLQSAVVRAKQTADLQASSITQCIAAEYLASAALPNRVRILCEVYAQRKNALADTLRERFGERISFRDPQGGMFLWATLSGGIDTRQLLPRARDEGVIYVPGAAFYARKPPQNALRLSFATASPATLVEGVARLARAYTAML